MPTITNITDYKKGDGLSTYERRKPGLFQWIMERPLKEPISESLVITTKEMREQADFRQDNVDKAKKNHLIVQTDGNGARGKYSFIAAKELREYVQKSIQKNPALIPIYLERIAIFAAADTSFCYEFLPLMKEYNRYKEIYRTLVALIDRNESETSVNNARLLLKALSYSFALPDECKKLVNSINPEEIVKTKEKDDPYRIFVLALCKGMLSLALSKLREVKKGVDLSSIESLMLTLLRERVKEESDDLQTIDQLIEEQNVAEIVGLLENKMKQKTLSQMEKFILMVAKDIVAAQKGQIFPQITNDAPKTFAQAINGKNYQVALEICVNKNVDVPIVRLLEIFIKEKKVFEIVAPIEVALESRKLDAAKMEIINLVKDKEKKEPYTVFLQELIDICQDEDSGYSRVIDAIKDIENDFSNIRVEDIWSSAMYYNNNGNMDMFARYMTLYTMAAYINDDLRSIVTTTDEYETLEDEQPEEEPLPHSLEEWQSMTSIPNREIPEDDEEVARLLHKNLIVKKELIILPPMSEKRISSLKKIIKSKYKDMSTYVMGEGAEQRLVIQYKLKVKNTLVNKDAAQIAYKDKSYPTACYLYGLTIHSLPIENISSPVSEYYARLGNSYLGLSQTKNMSPNRKYHYIHLGYQYFSLAQVLTQKESGPLDCSAAISCIAEECSLGLETVVNWSEASLNEEYYFGIKNFPDLLANIKSRITKTQNFDDACKELNLSEEEIDILYLMVARELYMLEKNGGSSNALADQIFETIASKKNNTERVKRIIEIIEKEKPYYSSRVREVPGEVISDVTAVMRKKAYWR